MKKKLKSLLTILRIGILVVWRCYQITIGVILVISFLAIYQVVNFFRIPDIMELRSENPKKTAFMENEYERLIAIGGEKEPFNDVIRYKWLPLKSIPVTLQELVLVAEDAKFYKHSGFDITEIEYAIVANHQKGQKARGASTISQQLVKNLYLSSEKSISRKVHEATITVVLESFLSKDRILELYLNIAQFGPGIFGVKEGALFHFGKSVDKLTMQEMVQLVCVIPSPLHWSVQSGKKAYTRHKNRVTRNYGVYKGFKNSIATKQDTTQVIPLDSGRGEAFDKLADTVEKSKWDQLSTKPAPIDINDSTGTNKASQGSGVDVSVPEDDMPGEELD